MKKIIDFEVLPEGHKLDMQMVDGHFNKNLAGKLVIQTEPKCGAYYMEGSQSYFWLSEDFVNFLLSLKDYLEVESEIISKESIFVPPLSSADLVYLAERYDVDELTKLRKNGLI